MVCKAKNSKYKSKTIKIGVYKPAQKAHEVFCFQ